MRQEKCQRCGVLQQWDIDKKRCSNCGATRSGYSPFQTLTLYVEPVPNKATITASDNEGGDVHK